jgi:predicted site-specific integrase-resolvase
MTRDGRLPAVEIRAGRLRIPSKAITALVGEG